ncbi:hypothetical protein ACVGOW_27220 [Pseudonocardia saturnea]
MTTSDRPPGTYRVADGAKVEFSDAMATWVPLAHDELIATARAYHTVITYPELGRRVQDSSGIGTRTLLTNWIGKLLDEVARRAETTGEPPLASLCVRKDGTIGPGYARASEATTDEPREDIELFAAHHRLLCYRKYAEDLPADGGKAALTSSEHARRAKKAAQNPVPRPKCPGCFTELPTAGHCDYCG